MALSSNDALYGKLQHVPPERNNFSAFSSNPSCRFWFSVYKEEVFSCHRIGTSQLNPSKFPVFLMLPWHFYIRGVKQILIFCQRYCCDHLCKNRTFFSSIFCFFYLFTDYRTIKTSLDISKIFLKVVVITQHK